MRSPVRRASARGRRASTSSRSGCDCARCPPVNRASLHQHSRSQHLGHLDPCWHRPDVERMAAKHHELVRYCLVNRIELLNRSMVRRLPQCRNNAPRMLIACATLKSPTSSIMFGLLKEGWYSQSLGRVLFLRDLAEAICVTAYHFLWTRTKMTLFNNLAANGFWKALRKRGHVGSPRILVIWFRTDLCSVFLRVDHQLFDRGLPEEVPIGQSPRHCSDSHANMCNSMFMSFFDARSVAPLGRRSKGALDKHKRASQGLRSQRE